MSRPSSEVQRDIDAINAERAKLATEQPEGWVDRYGELNKQLTDLSREWSEARISEEGTTT